MSSQKPFKDYYAVLGLPRNATDEQIRTAFREASRKHHPDTGNGNSEMFKEANEAFSALGRGGLDREARQRYDREYVLQSPRERWQAGTQREQSQNPWGSNPQGHPRYSSQPSTGGQQRRDTRGGLDDLFKDPEAFLKNMGFGTDDLLGAMGVGRNPYIRQQARETELMIPANDLGLLNALVKAYQSNEAGVWSVRKSELDRRAAMPEKIYEVTRSARGVIDFKRTINDWVGIRLRRASTYKQEEFYREGIRAGEMVDSARIYGFRTRTSSPDSFFGDDFWQPKIVAHYYEELKRLAEVKSAGRETSVSDMVYKAETINSMYLRNSDLYNKSGAFYLTEPVRSIPYSKLWDEVAKVEGLVVKEGTNRTPEGNFGSGESRI